MNKYICMSIAALLLAGCADKVIDERPVKEEKDDNYTYTKYQNPVIRNNCADPSVIDDRERTGYFYAYSTQNGTSGNADCVYLPVYRSADMVNWELVGNAFGEQAKRPQWVPDTRVWAPDIEYINGRYVLYYALGSMNDPAVSACGVAVSDSPEGPFTWENIKDLNPNANEHGMLTNMATQGISNNIDANIVKDQQTGELYLFWGSYGSNSGVWAVKMTDDGLALAPGAQKTFISYEMEGTYIHYKNGFYYCFGSKGSCCAGKSSTYHIVVGRSKNILGPYEGRDGKLMNVRSTAFDTPANTILSSSENLMFAGTGHDAEIITDDLGHDWMFYHAYWQGNNYDGRCMNMDEVVWGDGWPSFKTGHPSESKISGPTLKKAGTKASASVVDNDGAESLVQTGDPCSCRNTWSYSAQSNDVKLYEVKIYE